VTRWRLCGGAEGGQREKPEAKQADAGEGAALLARGAS
jgi:hypothetical protein